MSSAQPPVSLDRITTAPAWRDPALPVEQRVADLLSRMTLREKVAQLYSLWLNRAAGDSDVAPMQSEFTAEDIDVDDLLTDGLGQLTRPFGTATIDPSEGAKALRHMQSRVTASNRFGIPALVHEECLTGFMTARATVYPTPLAWAATFDPDLVSDMAGQIGTSMRSVGVHQGLAPVLDVVTDPRWGRTEETLGEDPYLVATMATAYVRGLQESGILATLKHFVGYSASKSARNFAPVGAGPRQIADVLLPPFEMAVRDGQAASVMHSYCEIDGIPSAADHKLLTEVLRYSWGFDGTVVSDYFGISFLHKLHGIADGPATAAAAALAAGVDVELPAVASYGAPLREAVEGDQVAESLVDRAAERVLRQKCQLGLLDPSREAAPREDIDLNPNAHRQLAQRIAEESVVVLTNHDTALPLADDKKIAVIGPAADLPHAMLGCYSFPNHVDATAGEPIGSLLAGIQESFPLSQVDHHPGCDIDGSDTTGIAPAAAIAARSEVCVAVLGDQSGLFGNGTSGEGCDRADLTLPGVQSHLLEALLDTETPVVLVLLTGRPYALGAFHERLAATVQAFFPGQEGGTAVARVLAGTVCPSGRLPASIPRHPNDPSPVYLSRRLEQSSDVSVVDTGALFGFGHGLSYTTFEWDAPLLNGTTAREVIDVDCDGECTVSLRVHNRGDMPGAEVVQLYLRDPVAQVTQPTQRLIGYAKVHLDPGQDRRISFTVPADMAAFTGIDGRRIVEPGDVELRLSRSSADCWRSLPIRLRGDTRVVGVDRALRCEVSYQ